MNQRGASICRGGLPLLTAVGVLGISIATAALAGDRLKLAWSENLLTIQGRNLPGGQVDVWYLEAYCRPGSSNRDWRKTVIGHTTQLQFRADDGSRLQLCCRLNDGVVVTHEITAGEDEVDFALTAENPTDHPSQAHWAQPCMRVDRFTGATQDSYLAKSFIFIDGALCRLPTRPWATRARYTPGQVWVPAGVDREDVNPRPISQLVPSHHLIGCFSRDGSKILATAWEPCQELFQGVIVCLHADVRIGGLNPGEKKQARGKIYVVDADVASLLKRYEDDFGTFTSWRSPRIILDFRGHAGLPGNRNRRYEAATRDWRCAQTPVARP